MILGMGAINNEVRMHRGIFFMGILGLALASMGCITRRVEYHPDYVPSVLSPGLSTPGRALLLVEPADEAYVYRGKPHSFHAGGVTMEMPLGQIISRSSERVLQDLFQDGCVVAPRIDPTFRYTAAIRIKPLTYDYAFNQIRNLTMAITPQVRLSIQVQMMDETGTLLFSQVYDSGMVNDETVLDTLHPNETINRHTHRVLGSLLARAAADIRATLMDRHPPPPVSTPLAPKPSANPTHPPAKEPQGDSPRARLEQLKQLREDGLITQDVYEAKQKEILADY
jgi:hypothetical protein